MVSLFNCNNRIRWEGIVSVMTDSFSSKILFDMKSQLKIFLHRGITGTLLVLNVIFLSFFLPSISFPFSYNCPIVV